MSAVEVIPPVLSSLSPSNLSRSRTFDDVRQEVAKRAARTLPSRVVAASDLRMSELGTIDVPNVGSLAMTDWARKQLGTELGIRWERWFRQTVSPAECAEEVNRRFARSTKAWLIRGRRYGHDDLAIGDGVLRGFVGPHFTPIDDDRLFERLAWALGARAAAMRFVRAEETERTSQYLAVTEEDIDLGVGGSDIHRNGFLVRNSEVGGAALWIIEYLFRLVCLNGLMVALSGRPVFRKAHRCSDQTKIDRDLSYAIAQLPQRWEQGQAVLLAARVDRIEEPEAFLRRILAEDPTVRPRTQAVLTAFRAEPNATRFGAIQALTRAAQGFSAEDRFEMERFAGQLLLAEGVS